MKIKLKLVLIVTAAAIAASFLSQTKGHAQAQTETAGQRFKNIKVLQDMPADQLGKVMNIFAGSLGVDCNFCHYPEDFAKDGKKEKDSAREMIKMTFAINKDNFRGRTEVSCATCHNGHEHPQGQPVLGPSPPEEPRAQTSVKPEVDAIIARYVAALGGAEKLARITSRSETATRIEGDGKKSEPEVLYFKQGKYSLKTTYGDRWLSDVYDGSTAYKFGPIESMSLKPDEAEQIRREAELFSPSSLKTIYPKMEYRFTDKLDGRPVYLVTATTASNQRERLYFDATTGLLVRRIAVTPTVIGNFIYQVDYSDYKWFDGVQVPTTVKYSMPNISWTRKVLTVKNNTPIDESVFQVPPAKN